MKTLFTIFISLIAFSTFSQTKQLSTDTIRMNVTVAQAKNIVDTTGINPDFIILDVRTASEYNNAHIANAINIDYYNAGFSALLDALDHNKMYLLHCASGGRSTPTFASMQTKHFREIYHMNNGLNAWISAGYPTVTGSTYIYKVNMTNFPKLYPNPTINYLNVQLASNEGGKLSILDLQGKLLQEIILTSEFQCIEMSDFSSGMYIIKIQSTEGVFTEKISIQ